MSKNNPNYFMCIQSYSTNSHISIPAALLVNPLAILGKNEAYN